MADLRKHFGWAVLLSEASHVFCCVLPTFVTACGILANIGLISAAPAFILELHEFLHEYEIPIIVFSGLMVVAGWVVHAATRDVDCHDTGCVHPPCDQKKSSNSKILIIATCLFALNLVIYFGIHRNIFGLEVFAKSNAALELHEMHDHHHEDHTDDHNF